MPNISIPPWAGGSSSHAGGQVRPRRSPAKARSEVATPRKQQHTFEQKHLEMTNFPQTSSLRETPAELSLIVPPKGSFFAISRYVVNHDGGAGRALDPLVWSAEALTKRRRLVHVVRDYAMLLGPPSNWLMGGSMLFSAFGAEMCSLALLCFRLGLVDDLLGSLHWLVGGADLGVGGVSCVEMLIFDELWAGERLTLEKAYLRYLRPYRPISVCVRAEDAQKSCARADGLQKS